MLTFIIFIIVLGVLIFVHEFGHFIFAKRAGMKVEEFGFGFPPRVWSKKKGGTIYSINAIPFGGFVKILGEDGEEKSNPKSFASKSAWARFQVIASGVLMNFLLAVVLLMIVNFFGLRVGILNSNQPGVQGKQIDIVQVSTGSPADQAGLRLLDEIKGFKTANGKQVDFTDVAQVQNYVSENAGRNITLLIGRNGGTIEKTLEPRQNPPAGQGALGISLAMTGVVKYPWYEALWRGVYDAVILLINTVYGYYLLFKTLFTTGKLLSDVSGPIGIATLTGQAARIGFSYLLQFVAMISVNLAVLNFIPFPALDGGRAVLLGVEKVRGTPLNKKIEIAINTIGFGLLILLMIYVTVKDVIKFF